MREEILERYPDAPLRVYAVWIPMIWSDRAGAVGRATPLLDDPRVEHFWDGEKETGRWFARKLEGDESGAAAWDVFYLFGAGAEWGEVPAPVEASGAPVIRERDELARAVAAALARP